MTRIFLGRHPKITVDYYNRLPYCPKLVKWPELDFHYTESHPRHPKDIYKRSDMLVGCDVITLSEHIIAWFVEQIRIGNIKKEDIEFWWVSDEHTAELIYYSKDPDTFADLLR